MKKYSKKILLSLLIIMVICGNLQYISASTIEKTGYSEIEAIPLELGKSKTASFPIGSGGVFFVVELPQSGNLDVNVICKSLGKDIVIEMYRQNSEFFKLAKSFYYDSRKKTQTDI